MRTCSALQSSVKGGGGSPEGGVAAGGTPGCGRAPRSAGAGVSPGDARAGIPPAGGGRGGGRGWVASTSALCIKTTLRITSRVKAEKAGLQKTTTVLLASS